MTGHEDVLVTLLAQNAENPDINLVLEVPLTKLVRDGPLIPDRP